MARIKDCEASEGVVAAPRSGGGNMGAQRYYLCLIPSCSRKKVCF